MIGETGLDYFRTGEDGRAAQHESFAAHIDLAKRLDKTLMIHDRDAHDDILRILDREGVPDRLVMHCFSGDTEFARECVNRGAFLSFAGVVTFKNAQSLRDALAVTPLDRVLVETDAPYLTPSPHRGQPNASYLIPHTVRKMAGVLNISVAELCDALNTNAKGPSAAHGEGPRRMPTSGDRLTAADAGRMDRVRRSSPRTTGRLHTPPRVPRGARVTGTSSSPPAR